MMAILRRPSTWRLAVSVAWLAIGIGFVHLSLNTDDLDGLDPGALLAVAAAIAIGLGVISWFRQDRRLRLTSGIAGAAVFLLAALLVLERAAHETGAVIALLGALLVTTWIVEGPRERDAR